ncbi:hypothetical protein EJB05_02749 [Eragrostis curvula]|uniref:trehalose-phosphatase n=1 Tax=Eragrostis curvula TaxID=38414 RepID=A0A5J9WTB5_9POAL|nr:hypothetical protein EJB05_02749 [Eragrostis curvula]
MMSIFWALLLLVSGTFTTHLKVAKSDRCWDFDCSSSRYSERNWYDKDMKRVERMLPRLTSSSSTFGSRERVGRFYTQAQCRADIHPTECKECLLQALKETRSFCAYSKRTAVYRDLCTVAMSNMDFQIFPMNISTVGKYNFSQQAVQQHYDRTTSTLLTAVAEKAAESATRFASGRQVVGVGDPYTVYATAYCFSLLASPECQLCLRGLIEGPMVSGLLGARQSNVWCGFRFELYKFFRGTPTTDLPELKNESAAKKHHKTVWLVVGVVGSVIFLFIVIAIAVTLWIRRSRRRQVLGLDHGEKGKGIQLSVEKLLLLSALEEFEDIIELSCGRTFALFLDYDGTLSPIVRNADEAFMSEEMREAVRSAAANFSTSIVTGRAREKVINFVKIKELTYAGSHGLDIVTAKGSSTTEEITEEEISFQPAKEYLEAMNKVYKRLVEATGGIVGASIEDNKYSVSVHYRNILHKKDRRRVKEIVDKILLEDENLKLQTGKKVWEIVPAIPWNKGDAVGYLLEALGMDDPERFFPIYIGDDKTDENAFKFLRERGNGIGVLVSKTRRETEASYWLKDPSEVMTFLQDLVKWKLDKASDAFMICLWAFGKAVVNKISTWHNGLEGRLVVAKDTIFSY